MSRRIIFFAVLTLAMSSNSITLGADKEAPQNLIIKEMVALDKAFKTTIDAVVLNRLDKIVPAFEDVHRVREEVEKTIKEGKKIALPKNQERFKLFVSLDNRFHKEAEILMESAKKNHIGRVQKQTNRLLGLCVRCHTMFRK
ncbi:MAG: hypothetical protein A2X54_03780 [Nitrospirae bacterium GWF2_44_13]|nr:MAG: hypothetical protein A2X54_03780 [Nitrospirae bacterium GWF2_44_13]OGW34859.1 MAG: hypothetical protein A2088_04420 [Nitrospirae bacterium GWD2_44_7]OGW65524.1 MAG: hypothetical protein A2222_02575 [Nitrospirae bacterium RIFOXYA2_FULL_44_9]HBG92517.1 hypothetical protein [Nitrospiraceae bacterium]HBU06397.1 hypothetical protein [Nitrospiraceae bacterium]